MRRRYFEILRNIRNHFESRNLMEVLVPTVVDHPGIEPHIHPFAVVCERTKKFKGYLPTSPEFAMKQLLSEGFQDIFSLGRVFRDEPISPIHNFEFTMLEWYRQGELDGVIEDATSLVQNLGGPKKFPIEKRTMNELCMEFGSLDILELLEENELRKCLEKDFPELPLPKGELPWEDLFYLFFLNTIEPHLKKFPLLVISDYPAPLKALAEVSSLDSRVCCRSEIFLKGIELANGYYELRDLNEQKKRFHEENQKKKKLYNYELAEPNVLFKALEKGIPKSSGMALGVERLLMGLTNQEKLFF